MVNPLGSRIAKYAAAQANHDVVLTMKQGLKLAVRFVQGSGKQMKAIYDKAQAKQDARNAVTQAIQELEKVNGAYRSPDLDYLGSILKTVVKLTPEDQQGKLKSRDFRVALFDQAWKKSIDDKKGIIHLKHRERAPRDGTKELRSELRNKAQGGLQEFRTAMQLVDMLNAVKQCEDRDQLFGILARNPDALSSAALWENQTARNEFACFGPPLSISQLAILAKTKDVEAKQELRKPPEARKPVVITKEEVYGLMKTLKDATDLPEEYYIDLTNTVDLSRPRHEIELQISKIIGDHYLERLGLSAESKEAIAQRIEGETAIEGVINALKDAHGEALERTKVPKDQLVEAIGTALRDFLHPDRKPSKSEKRMAADVVVQAKIRMKKAGRPFSQDEIGRRILLDFARLEARAHRGKVRDGALKEEVFAEIYRREGDVALGTTPQAVDERWGKVRPSEFLAALQEAGEIPIKDGLMDANQLVKLFVKRFNVFSGPVWIHEDVRVSLGEYYNFGRSLAVLHKLFSKASYTKDDLKFLQDTFGTREPSEVGTEEDDEFGNLFRGPSDKKISDTNPSLLEIDLSADRETILSNMLDAVAGHYILSGKVNLSASEGREFLVNFDPKTKGPAELLEALERGFAAALKSTRLDRARFIAPLEDLALLLPPAKDHESLVTDDD